MDNQKESKLSAVKDVLIMEIKVASMALFAVYLLFLIIKFFTFDGRCSNLIMEASRPSCSYLYAVFIEPIWGILFFAVMLSMDLDSVVRNYYNRIDGYKFKEIELENGSQI